MNKDEVVKKIKSKGYWGINIRPDVYNSQRIEKQKIKDIVRSAVVKLRGWDYPHFRDSEGEPYPILDGIEKIIDWSNHIEFWRMTKSANFFHLLALREDWIEPEVYKHIEFGLGESKDPQNKRWLGVLGTLYTLTEIFEFVKRLASQNIFDDNVIIEIKLYNLNNRRLIVDSPNRAGFMSPRIAKISEPWTYHTQTFLVNDLLNKSDQLTLDAFLDLIYLFEWENLPIETFKNDIQKFLQGRI